MNDERSEPIPQRAQADLVGSPVVSKDRSVFVVGGRGGSFCDAAPILWLLPGLLILAWGQAANAVDGHSRCALLAGLVGTACAWPRRGERAGVWFRVAMCLPLLFTAWWLDRKVGLRGERSMWLLASSLLTLLACASFGAPVARAKQVWHLAIFGVLWCLPMVLLLWLHVSGTEAPGLRGLLQDAPLPAFWQGSDIFGAHVSGWQLAAIASAGVAVLCQFTLRRRG